jgi:hypothetical protein
MGFQNFGDFGHPRHPAIRTTGLLTFALAGLTPAEHTSLTGSQLPDGRISRVRLATMTVPARSSLASPWLKRSLAYTPSATGLSRSSIAACRPDYAGTESGMGGTRLPAMTESPLAPLRCYLLGSRVEHDLDQRYPVLVAPTGSCARPRSSVSLCIRSDPQSLQVAVSPCCI